MRVIYEKIDKQLMADMPRALFEGRIEVVESESAAERAVAFLLSEPILGIDTETRPTFTSGAQNKVALLQVSTHEVCFLFRLNHIGMTDSILRLLSDTTIPKVGLSLHDDLMMLERRQSFQRGTFIDLQQVVGEFGIQDRSLQKLYANLFGQKISKAQRLSNWEADILSESQKLYAATDAWACIRIYEELQQLDKEQIELIHNA